MDEEDEHAAKILDKSCANGGSITVVDVARLSISAVDGSMGASSDTWRPEKRVRGELVPKEELICELLEVVVLLENVLLRDPPVPRDDIVDCDKESMLGIGGVETNEERSSFSLHNA